MAESVTPQPSPAMDDYGQRLCPLRGCESPLHLSQSFCGPVHPQMGMEAADAYTRQWEIGCENGHTVLTTEGAEDWNDPPEYDAIVLALFGETRD